MAWDCAKYYDYLFDRTPHFDEKVLEDWQPTDDAWIGQVSTEAWSAFTGTQHTYDRVHVAQPDLSQAWALVDFENSTCVTNACKPPEICVGSGSTRKTYHRERIRYTTKVFCFDQIDTRAKAREQIASIVKGNREITKMVQSDYLRTRALSMADNIYIAGTALTVVPIAPGVITGNCSIINLGGAGNIPTSNLTIEYLQRFYEPLKFDGYFRGKNVQNNMFKLITDMITSQQLTSGNPALVAAFKFSDFNKGGEMFKYGLSAAIGNYGIAWDDYPMRFNHVGNGVLQRVWPRLNVAATIGLRPIPNPAYVLAPIQVSQVWHPNGMVRLVPKLESVNPEMPFLTRDLGGKWTFTGPNSDTFIATDPTDGTLCTVDNKARNQGVWWADFENAIRFERPELVRGILHLREPGCVVDSVPCTPAPAYATQDYGSCNPVCEEQPT